MDKPEISILSDQFLDAFQNMKYKNLAFAALKKLLADEIRVKSRKNKVLSRKFSEMLEDAITKYNNRSIDAAQVIMELLEIAKNLQDAQRRGEELNLTDEEIAFYDALANNESARDILGDEILSKMARELSAKIRKNTTIDWKFRERPSVQSRESWSNASSATTAIPPTNRKWPRIWY